MVIFVSVDALVDPNAVVLELVLVLDVSAPVAKFQQKLL